MSIVDALRNLYVKITGADEAPAENQIAELIQKIADDLPEKEPAESGQE